MGVKEVVKERRSIRTFSPEPVSRMVLEQIIEQALWAPSWGNTQPWGLTIVGGKILERIKKEFLQLTNQGVTPNPDLSMPTMWNVLQTARYKELGKTLFQALSIRREDQQKREEYYRQMTLCFGAPHVIYLHLEKGFNPYALVDCGLIMQTIALLAVERNLGTCFLARSIHYPDVVRKHTQISSNRRLIIGIAIGYPIPDHPANLFRSQRGSFEEFIQWLDDKVEKA